MLMNTAARFNRGTVHDTGEPSNPASRGACNVYHVTIRNDVIIASATEIDTGGILAKKNSARGRTLIKPHLSVYVFGTPRIIRGTPDRLFERSVLMGLPEGCCRN